MKVTTCPKLGVVGTYQGFTTFHHYYLVLHYRVMTVDERWFLRNRKKPQNRGKCHTPLSVVIVM